MSPARVNRAKNMLKQGYTQAEVADHLGVSTAVINKYVDVKNETKGENE